MAGRRAQIVGTGLIGGSIALALRQQGWHVTGRDLDGAGAARALELGALDDVGDDTSAELTFVCTPVGAIAAEVRHALEVTDGVVSDVGSVKAPIVAAVGNPRFVGGHPMAGSEQVGIEGADAAIFEGAVWALAPSTETDDDALLTVRSVVSSFGAEPVTLDPERHDRLVAVVSHVPHLTAATLMTMADARNEDHRVLLRLAAGGFRDMTRVASGSAAIWPDICTENRSAIVDSLDDLIGRLFAIRGLVKAGNRSSLLHILEAARLARQNLPVGVERPDELATVRVPIPDRPGMLAEVTTAATDLGINIVDIEIAHSGEGERGVLILLVGAEAASVLVARLAEQGLRASVELLA